MNNVHIDAQDWISSYGLTHRESDVLACLLENHSAKKISCVLDIKQKTVETHIYNIMQKLDKHGRVALIDFVKRSAAARFLFVRCRDLTMNYEFHENIKNIKQRVHCKEVYCKLECQDEIIKKKLEEDLKHFNIFCFERKKEVQTFHVQIYQDYPVTFFNVLKSILHHPFVEEAFIRFQKFPKDSSHENVITHIINSNSYQRMNKNFFYKIISFLFFVIIFIIFLSYESISPEPVVRYYSLALNDTKFFKRHDIFNKMKKILDSKKQITIVSLVGLSGSGKTSLAQQYAIQEKASIVFLLHAENKNALIQSFLDFACELSHTKELRQELEYIKSIKDREYFVNQLIRYVKNRLRNKKWCLIYDNVDSIDDIECFLPNDFEVWGNGKVIITTQNNHISNHNFIRNDDIVEILELNEQEKYDLFNLILGKATKDQEKLRVFLKSIPSYPLDIYTAAYYIKNTNNTYDEYLEMLKKQDVHYFKDIGYYGKTRQQILSNSIQHIIQHNKKFVEFFFFLGMLNNNSIPVRYFKELGESKTVDVFMKSLANFSLIKRYSDGSFSIHQITQNHIVDYLLSKYSREEQIIMLENIMICLEKIIKREISLMQKDYLKEILVHINKFLTHSFLDDQNKKRLEVGIAKIYFQLGEIQRAKIYLESNIDFIKSSKDVDIFSGLMYLGAIYDELADHHHAQLTLEEFIRVLKSKYCGEEIMLADAYCYLGKSYSQLGNAKKSQLLLEESIRIYEKYNEKKQFGYSNAITLLAECHMYSGNYRIAEQLFSKNQSFYYNNSKSTQQLWNTLRIGRLYMFLGKHDKSRSIFEKGIEDLRKYFKNDEEKLAWQLAYLGDVYRVLGLFEKAEETLQEGYNIYQKIYGSSHIMIDWYNSYFGYFYYDTGKYKKALLYLEKSLKTFKERYKCNPKRYIPIMHILAKVHTKIKNFDKAESLYNEVLSFYAKEFGKDESQYALVLKDYALLYQERLDYNVCEKLLKESFLILEKNGHLERYVCLEYLADLYKQQKKQKEAKTYYQKALHVAKEFLDKDSFHVKRMKKKIRQQSKWWPYIKWFYNE
ncbi:MAG: hypothetical protein HEEMFOPI_01494 [Holosporales bacterium]